jgi:hypothetical protein
MDIYKISNEIIKFYIPGVERIKIDKDKAEYKN